MLDIHQWDSAAEAQSSTSTIVPGSYSMTDASICSLLFDFLFFGRHNSTTNSIQGYELTARTSELNPQQRDIFALNFCVHKANKG